MASLYLYLDKGPHRPLAIVTISPLRLRRGWPMAIRYKDETELLYRFGRKGRAKVGKPRTVIFVLVGLALVVDVGLLIAMLIK